MPFAFRVVTTLALWLKSKIRPLPYPSDPFRCRFFTWPHHIDYNGHVNNAVHIQLMEKGRTEVVLREGTFINLCVTSGFSFIVASVHSQYLRTIPPLVNVDVVTYIRSWVEDRWLMIEHYIVEPDDRDGTRPYAVAFARCCVTRKGKPVTRTELLEKGVAWDVVEKPPLRYESLKKLMELDMIWREDVRNVNAPFRKSK